MSEGVKARENLAGYAHSDNKGSVLEIRNKINRNMSFNL